MRPFLPLVLSAQLARAGTSYRVSALNAEFADSRLAGKFIADFTENLPTVNGQLHASELDFNRMSSLLPTKAQKPAATVQDVADRSEDLLSDEPLDFSKLHRANGKIFLTADELSYNRTRFTGLNSMLTLQQGALRVAPMAANLKARRGPRLALAG